MMLFAATLNAQIIFQISDKRAEIVPQVTYDTAVALSLNQMDNIMIELLKCDSIAATSIISDLQLDKYKSLVSMQNEQINAVKYALNTSNNFNKVLQADLRNLQAAQEQTETKLKRNRKIAISASLVAALELLFIL